MIQESLEEMNTMLRKSQKRLQHWVVESHDTKQLITSLGTVTFEKNLFTNKETGESEYLLDRIIGLEKHERITEDAQVRMLKEAVQTSYRRGGEETNLTTDVKKQTVKNKIHALEFPKTMRNLKRKKRLNISISRQMKIMHHFSSERRKVIWLKMKIIRKTTV